MPVSDQPDQMFDELAHALSLVVYARCVVDADSNAEYEHFCENNLEIAPDILARLGVMRPTDPDDLMLSARHVFEAEWFPEKPLPLKRHIGEPSLFDLILAVCWMVYWDNPITERFKELTPLSIDKPFELGLEDHRRFNSKQQIKFQYLAFRQAATCLEKLGLGEWVKDGGFELIPSLNGDGLIALVGSYHSIRRLTAKRLGGVQALFPF